MTNAIYLTATEPFSGKSLFALGLMSLLAAKTDKLAYFKPVISVGKREKDRRLDLIKSHFKLAQSYEDMYVFSRKRAIKEINIGNEAFLIDSIIDRFKKLQESSEFVVVEGTDFVDTATNVEFDGNISIAKNLGIPAAIILNCSRRSVAEIVDLAQATVQGFVRRGVQVLVLVANKIEVGKEEEVAKRLNAVIPTETLVTTIPMQVELSNPTMEEVMKSLDAKLLFGESLLTNRVDHSIVGAMQLPNFLERLHPNSLMVTPGDRGDLIIGTLQANISRNFGKVAGIIVSGGISPDPSIVKLIEGLETIVPILEVDKPTFLAVTEVNQIRSRIAATDTEKISIAIRLFEKWVDEKALSDRIVSFHSETLTPRMFQYQLVKRAK